MVRPNKGSGLSHHDGGEHDETERAVKSNAMKVAQEMADEVDDYRRRVLHDSRSLSVRANTYRAWGISETPVVELSNRRGDMEPFTSVRAAKRFIDGIAKHGW